MVARGYLEGNSTLVLQEKRETSTRLLRHNQALVRKARVKRVE